MKPALSLLVCALILAGCSGPTADGSQAGSPSTTLGSTTTAPEASPSATTPTPSPTPTTKAPTPTPSYSADELALIQADERSLLDPNTPAFIDQAHDLCEAFASINDEDIFRALKDVEEEQRLTSGRIMLLLCQEPRFVPLVVAAEVPDSFVSGTYYVGTEPGEIAPGKYKTIGGVQDCYWVRKDDAGEILDNDNVANAPGGVRLTVQASDYEVTMNRCGIWVPAK